MIGGEAISDSKKDQLCYAYQLPPPSSTSPRTAVYLILWVAKQVGSSTEDSNNLLTEIHGHPISADLDKKAVYALQPDYSLKELRLTPAEVERLISNRQDAQTAMMQNQTPKRLQDDEVFKTKVFSQLAHVESPK